MSQYAACARAQESLWRYIDRELSASVLAEISAHLKGCRDCNLLYEARARDLKLYRLAFAGSPFGEGFAERFHKRLDQEVLADPFKGNSSRSRAGVFRSPELLWAGMRADPRKFFTRLAPFAALVAIGVLVFIGLTPDRKLGSLEVSGAVEMFRAGRLLSSAEIEFRSGDSFFLRESSEVRMRLLDGSSLSLRGPAAFQVEEVSRPDGSFQVRMEEGTLRASVEPRAGRELRIHSPSPQATAVVLGTRFTLRIERDVRAFLEVDQGQVLFRGDPGQEYQPVNSRTGPYEVRGSYGRAMPVEESASPEASLSSGELPELPLATLSSPPQSPPGGTVPLDPKASAPPAPTSPAIDLPVTGR